MTTNRWQHHTYRWQHHNNTATPGGSISTNIIGHWQAVMVSPNVAASQLHPVYVWADKRTLGTIIGMSITLGEDQYRLQPEMDVNPPPLDQNLETLALRKRIFQTIDAINCHFSATGRFLERRDYGIRLVDHPISPSAIDNPFFPPLRIDYFSSLSMDHVVEIITKCHHIGVLKEQMHQLRTAIHTDIPQVPSRSLAYLIQPLVDRLEHEVSTITADTHASLKPFYGTQIRIDPLSSFNVSIYGPINENIYNI
jgi:hypothetical protein